MKVEKLSINFILGFDVLVKLNKTLFLFIERRKSYLFKDSIEVYKLIDTFFFSKKTFGDDNSFAFGGLPFEGELRG